MKKTICNLSAVCFMLFLILANLFWVGNSDNFYLKQYVKNNTTHYTGMEITPLLQATDLLQDYLNDDIDHLDMQVEKWGEVKELFDSREKTHMIDVKVLYLTFEKVMYILLGLALAGFGWAYYTDKSGFAKNLAAGFRFTVIIAVVLCLFFGGFFLIGFDTFWTTFHKIVFTNDLWLLDPKISTMINMFPLNFWLAMCTRALTGFGAMFLACFVGVTVLRKRKAG